MKDKQIITDDLLSAAMAIYKLACFSSLLFYKKDRYGN
ncbi:MAG: hypothetical protein JWO58_2161 [Chitinophagaceae bacterium]|nr:hypothetical protein [Chitinophagaceae bacterium]